MIQTKLDRDVFHSAPLKLVRGETHLSTPDSCNKKVQPQLMYSVLSLCVAGASGAMARCPCATTATRATSSGASKTHIMHWYDSQFKHAWLCPLFSKRRHTSWFDVCFASQHPPVTFQVLRANTFRIQDLYIYILKKNL